MTMNRSRCTPAKFQTTSGCSRVVRKPWNRQEGPPPPPPWLLAAANDVTFATSAAMEERKRDGEEKPRKRRERAELKAPRWNRNIVFGFEI